MATFQRILVATDFGESSERALDLSMTLAKQFGAALMLVHTYEIPTYVYSGMNFAVADMLTPVETAAREELDRALREVQQQVPGAKALLRNGVPWREILAAIDDTQADLVVMGTHGRRALLGSVAEKVVRLSPVPVLTVRGAPSSG